MAEGDGEQKDRPAPIQMGLYGLLDFFATMG
jgi:hypothetical protein